MKNKFAFVFQTFISLMHQNRKPKVNPCDYYLFIN